MEAERLERNMRRCARVGGNADHDETVWALAEIDRLRDATRQALSAMNYFLPESLYKDSDHPDHEEGLAVYNVKRDLMAALGKD